MEMENNAETHNRKNSSDRRVDDHIILVLNERRCGEDRRDKPGFAEKLKIKLSPLFRIFNSKPN